MERRFVHADGHSGNIWAPSDLSAAADRGLGAEGRPRSHRHLPKRELSKFALNLSIHSLFLLIYDQRVPHATTNLLGRRRVAPLLLASLLAGGALVSAPWRAAAGQREAALRAPAGAVRLYVPFNAGGESDASARNFQRSALRLLDGRGLEIIHLTAEFGGAAGRAVQEAPPDGGTLLLARVGSLAVLPAIAPRTTPAWSDLTVLGVLDQAPLICFVRAGAPWRTLRELQAALAARPGQLRFSAAGANTIQAIAVRYLLSLSGLPADAARAVHFSQGTQITQAVLNGEADFACNTPRSVLPLMESGQLRPLLTTAQGRLKALPRLQNAAELGLRDMQHLQAWSALLGPPGMPPAVVDRWRAILDQVAADPEWVIATEALGASPRIRATPDPTQLMRQQAQFYERLVTLLGLLP
jgi:tripartite-type tricarboxylate transporter receptor subunit TctC